MGGVNVGLAGAGQKLTPHGRPVFPSRTEAPEVLIGNPIDIAKPERRDGLCNRLAHAEEDERGIGICSSGMPCEGECGSCELRRCRSREMHEPGSVGIGSQWL